MTRSTESQDWDALRAGVIGLGAHSARKSYYPELQRRLDQLELFRALLDGSNDVIMLLGLPEGTVIDANQAAAELLAINGGVARLAETIPTASATTLLDALNHHKDILLDVNLGPVNTPYEIGARTISLNDHDFAIVVARDITDRRLADESEREHRRRLEAEVANRTEELRRSNEELVQATRAKDEFLASMSHELRTPLNSVIGFSDIMLRGLAGDTTDEQQRQLVMVNNAGKHLLALINQVLDLAKIESGQAEVTLEAFDACDLVKQVAELVSSQADANGLKLEVECEIAVPQITSDRQRVLQILLNLAGNAVKFTECGTVGMSLSCEGDVLVFRVSDSGAGIPPHEQLDIWEPFRQGAVRGEMKPAGTGLGLSISRELAALLGGSLELENSSAEGSTFTLRLPHSCNLGRD
jgi:signal transduction histidine kinase